MTSRYDLMADSNVADTDGDTWPNPLSVNFNNAKLTSIPTEHVVSRGDISKFWYYYYQRYGTTELDDLLLTLNGIPYIGCLEEGDKIAEISGDDINSFYSGERS